MACQRAPYACSWMKMKKKDHIECQREYEKFWKLVLGTGMYISCFPEVVKFGPPDDLKHPAHHQYCEPITIGISENIKERASLGGSHSSPTAHFRKGHFRILRSDKFTHKRFQSVFVSETFVNRDKSLTVLSPEEIGATA